MSDKRFDVKNNVTFSMNSSFEQLKMKDNDTSTKFLILTFTFVKYFPVFNQNFVFEDGFFRLAWYISSSSNVSVSTIQPLI